jgi:uncharacterized protein YijF (DUF1287 family)
LKTTSVIVAAGLFFCTVCLSAPIDSVKRVLDNALWQTTVTKYYDAAYVRIPYPNGDVPIDRGVCTDVIVRAFRAVDIDLQKLIHEDMKKHFSAYPTTWGLKKPDANIDHRRVSNIARYLKQTGKKVPLSKNGRDYKPGDIVTWIIPGDLDHIGLISSIPVDSTDRFKVIHNIGNGAQLEDVLFEFKITGHYRYFSEIK